MNSILKKIVWLVAIIPAVYLAAVWNKLPQRIVMHYDFEGTPNRYGNKNELAILIAILIVLSILIYFFLANMYRFDPKKNAADNKDRLLRIAFAVLMFMTAIACVIIYSSMIGSIQFSMGLIFSAVGLLFAFIGNYMPNMKPNYFAGFRMPWTLQNEDNWRKTHLLAGKLWFGGGLIIAILCLLTAPVASMIIFITITVVLILIPGIYSYRIYKKQKSMQG